MWEITDAQAALAQLVDEMRPACDLMVLLAHATREETVALARRFPQFDAVVTADGPPVPPAEPARIDGSKTMLVQVGERVAAAEIGADATRQQQQQAAIRLTQADAKRLVCVRCHDVSNSPDFDFDAYWPDVAHGEDQ